MPLLENKNIKPIKDSVQRRFSFHGDESLESPHHGPLPNNGLEPPENLKIAFPERADAGSPDNDTSDFGRKNTVGPHEDAPSDAPRRATSTLGFPRWWSRPRSNVSDTIEVIHSTTATMALDEDDLEFLNDEPDLELTTYTPELWSHTVDQENLKHVEATDEKRQNAIWELIREEKGHVRRLKILQKMFVTDMSQSQNFTGDQIDRIFPKLKELMELHTTFLRNLLARQAVTESMWIEEIGDLLLEQFVGDTAQRMKDTYGIYCSRESDAKQYYEDIFHTNKKFRSFVNACANRRICKRFKIPEFLGKIRSHLSNYPLLIKRVLQYTSDPEEKETLRLVCEQSASIVKHVNDHVDYQMKLFHIQSRLETRAINYDGERFKNQDLTWRYRQLLHCGPMTWMNSRGREQELLVLVLTDLVVFLQEQGQQQTLSWFFIHEDKFVKKTCILSLRHLLVVSKNDTRDSTGLFLMNIPDDKQERYTLWCASQEDRDAWKKQLNCAIQNCPLEDNKAQISAMRELVVAASPSLPSTTSPSSPPPIPPLSQSSSSSLSSPSSPQALPTKSSTSSSEQNREQTSEASSPLPPPRPLPSLPPLPPRSPSQTPPPLPPRPPSSPPKPQQTPGCVPPPLPSRPAPPPPSPQQVPPRPQSSPTQATDGGSTNSKRGNDEEEERINNIYKQIDHQNNLIRECCAKKNLLIDALMQISSPDVCLKPSHDFPMCQDLCMCAKSKIKRDQKACAKTPRYQNTLIEREENDIGYSASPDQAQLDQVDSGQSDKQNDFTPAKIRSDNEDLVFLERVSSPPQLGPHVHQWRRRNGSKGRGHSGDVRRSSVSSGSSSDAAESRWERLDKRGDSSPSGFAAARGNGHAYFEEEGEGSDDFSDSQEFLWKKLKEGNSSDSSNDTSETEKAASRNEKLKENHRRTHSDKPTESPLWETFETGGSFDNFNGANAVETFSCSHPSFNIEQIASSVRQLVEQTHVAKDLMSRQNAQIQSLQLELEQAKSEIKTFSMRVYQGGDISKPRDQMDDLRKLLGEVTLEKVELEGKKASMSAMLEIQRKKLDELKRELDNERENRKSQIEKSAHAQVDIVDEGKQSLESSRGSHTNGHQDSFGIDYNNNMAEEDVMENPFGRHFQFIDNFNERRTSSMNEQSPSTVSPSTLIWDFPFDLQQSRLIMTPKMTRAMSANDLLDPQPRQMGGLNNNRSIPTNLNQTLGSCHTKSPTQMFNNHPLLLTGIGSGGPAPGAPASDSEWINSFWSNASSV